MNNDSYTNESTSRFEIDKVYHDRDSKYNIRDTSKIRSNTENSVEESVINTSLAKAQRDRYVNEQLFMQKQRMQ